MLIGTGAAVTVNAKRTEIQVEVSDLAVAASSGVGLNALPKRLGLS
jgi:hypothetical protein